MMINRMQHKFQPMNLVHKTQEGTQLWLGDYYAATNLNLLRQKNIKSVLTAAAMLGVNYPGSEQINHKVINAFDMPSYKMTPHFEEAFQFISNALKKGNILVHCAAGISRSTTFVIVYLMRAEGMACKQAIDHVRSKRAIICPNEGFQKELKRYETIAKKLSPTVQTGNKQAKLTNSQNLQQKQAILEKPKQQITADNSKSVNKMSSTLGPQSIPNKTFNNPNAGNNMGIFRGKSLNYTKKPTHILLPNNNQRQQKQPNQEVKVAKQSKDNKTQIGKFTQQFLTFKLENPKIVTIKK